MFTATVIAPRKRAWPGYLVFLSAMVVLALSTTGSAGEDECVQVIRHGKSELRFAVPYQAGKVPVVFIHGLLGSRAIWSVMIDRLSADPVVRGRFQFLTFDYDTLQSIPESGLQLAEVLDEARRRFDPEGADRSFERVVVVGHSMGGLVAKAGTQAIDRRRLELHRGMPHSDGPTLVPRVGRYIFIATPHRGASINRGAIRSLGNWLARNLGPPSEVGGASSSSVDQLAWEHPLLAELERGRATESTPFHSIIAALHDPSSDGATDGVVPVKSARLNGARSEVVIQTHHLCFQHPEVIREVDKILREHASPHAGLASSTDGRPGSVTSVSIGVPSLGANP